MQSNSAKAILRRVKISPQKLNIVAALIRGMQAQKALDVLSCSKRRIADDVSKTLKSAIANAENNQGLNSAMLYVKEAHVGYSIKLRRFHARGRGKGSSINKPSSHLTIIVEERE